jgi:hypothetical protein
MMGLRRACPALLSLAWLAGCASTQTVSLECVPSEVVVYVDGRALDGRPQEISLGVDEAHTLYFKGGSYQPQMVVMESEEVDGDRRLSHPDPCREVVFTEMAPEVHFDVAPEDVPAAAP